MIRIKATAKPATPLKGMKRPAPTTAGVKGSIAKEFKKMPKMSKKY